MVILKKSLRNKKLDFKFSFEKLDKNYHKKRPGFTYLRRESIVYLRARHYISAQKLHICAKITLYA